MFKFLTFLAILTFPLHGDVLYWMVSDPETIYPIVQDLEYDEKVLIVEPLERKTNLEKSLDSLQWWFYTETCLEAGKDHLNYDGMISSGIIGCGSIW